MLFFFEKKNVNVEVENLCIYFQVGRLHSTLQQRQKLEQVVPIVQILHRNHLVNYIILLNYIFLKHSSSILYYVKYQPFLVNA